MCLPRLALAAYCHLSSFVAALPGAPNPASKPGGPSLAAACCREKYSAGKREGIVRAAEHINLLISVVHKLLLRNQAAKPTKAEQVLIKTPQKELTPDEPFEWRFLQGPASCSPASSALSFPFVQSPSPVSRLARPAGCSSFISVGILISSTGLSCKLQISTIDEIDGLAS